MIRLQILLFMFFAVLFWPAMAQAQKKADLSSDFDKDVNLSGCVFSGLKLPPETKIYAAGAYGGSKRGWLIDDSGREATLIKVAVNSPKEPVVLLLGAAEPNIWHIGWTKGSQIKAVVVSGLNTQRIVGLPKNVPVLISTEENGAACGEFYIEGSQKSIPPKASTIARRLFGREIDNMFGVIGGQAVVGEMLPAEAKLITNAELRREDFHPANKPLFGEAGLGEAVNKGLIRKATEEDIQGYYKLDLSNKGLPDHLMPSTVANNLGPDTYVVLSSEFLMPDGLHYGDKHKFILPEGMPEPNCPSRNCGFLSMAKVDKKEPISFECNIPDLELPPNLKVYAARTWPSGLPLNFSLDGTDADVKLQQITVNSPEEPVALMLGGSDQTIWHFSWTKGTKIVAIVISDDHPDPILMGLPDDVVILNTSNFRGKTCPSVNSDFGEKGILNTNNLSKHLFHKNIERFSRIIDEDNILFGKPPEPGARLETGEHFSIEKFTDPNKPRTVKLALEAALNKGLIQYAAKKDVQAYFTALAKGVGLSDGLINESLGLGADATYEPYADEKLLDSYVILSPDFSIPTDLYPTRNVARYILPEDMPRPASLPKKSEIYSLAEAKQGNRAKKIASADDDRLNLRVEVKERPTGSFQISGSKSSEKEEMPSVCSFPNLKMPPKLKVYAGSDFLSSPVDFAVDGKRLRSELIPITVNSPDEPVALILNEGKRQWPTIWHFSWTKGTKIAAVVVNGGSNQRLIGLPEGTPVLNTAGNKNNQCSGLFFPETRLDSGDLVRLRHLNDLSNHLFERDLDHLYFAESSRSLFGQAMGDGTRLISSEELKIENLIDPDKPWANQATLTEDMLKGLIRKRTAGDPRRHSEALAAALGLPEHIIKDFKFSELIRNTYRGFVCHTGMPYKKPSPRLAEYTVLSADYGIPATLYRSEIVPGSDSLDSYNSLAASFYYPDGSMVRCSYYPSGSEHNDETRLKLKYSKNSSKPGNISNIQLPPDFRLINKASSQDDAYEILSPDHINPAHNSWRLEASFPLPDGSRTECSFRSLAEEVAAKQPKKSILKACAIPDFTAPPNLKVYAASVKNGSKLHIPLGKSGRSAELVKITVNSPKEPVALMLEAGSSAPTIWHISWTEGTQIAAVVLSGSDAQRISGLPEGIPSEAKLCPSFHVSSIALAGTKELNDLSRHLFQKDVAKMFEFRHGQGLIGEEPGPDIKVITAEEFNKEKFIEPGTRPNGELGLRQALNQGLIRKATDDDYQKWLRRHYTKVLKVPEDKIEEAMGSDRHSYKKPPSPGRAYVVLSPDFIVPAGLCGEICIFSTASFIVPEGIPKPPKQGFDRSTFYLMDDGSYSEPLY